MKRPDTRDRPTSRCGIREGCVRVNRRSTIDENASLVTDECDTSNKDRWGGRSSIGDGSIVIQSQDTSTVSGDRETVSVEGVEKGGGNGVREGNSSHYFLAKGKRGRPGRILPRLERNCPPLSSGSCPHRLSGRRRRPP